jgi:hypothetical protein
MKSGQMVRVKLTSTVARECKIAPGSMGTVVCSYEIVARECRNSERIDVRFGKGVMVWGRPAADYEAIPEKSDA